jgi:hypothetical protein
MKKYLSSLFLLIVFFICSSSAASAAKIPTCDDKKVLQWVENYLFVDNWKIPRNKIDFQMKSLIETFSNPNERGCRVTVHTKLNSSSLREMNGYLDVWSKETGGKFPPDWLQNFSLEKEQQLSFSLNYDLIKKDWIATNVKGGYSPTHLVSYRTATNLDLMDYIKRLKDSDERRRIAAERPMPGLGPALSRDTSGK